MPTMYGNSQCGFLKSYWLFIMMTAQKFFEAYKKSKLGSTTDLQIKIYFLLPFSSAFRDFGRLFHIYCQVFLTVAPGNHHQTSMTYGKTTYAVQ